MLESLVLLSTSVSGPCVTSSKGMTRGPGALNSTFLLVPSLLPFYLLPEYRSDY